MRKMILYIAASLDGFIARSDGDLDWLFTDQDYGFKEFYNSIDTILMGRRTYEKILSFGGAYPHADRENIVFSRTPRRGNQYLRFVTGEADGYARALKIKEGKDIWLAGGGELNTHMLNNNLIDEMIISIHPIVLGAGIPLFAFGPKPKNFLLNKHISFESGLLQVTYKRL